jgi:hypothetical protein
MCVLSSAIHSMREKLSRASRWCPAPAALASRRRGADRVGAAAARICIMHIFGLLHPTALSVLRLQAAQASDAHANRFPGGKKSFINAMISAVSCAIQKRNGIIIHTTLQKILAAAPPPQVAIIIP